MAMNKTRPETPQGTAAIELSGTLSLRSHDRNWGSAKRMALLQAIDTQGSITAAAKQVGLSYKAAWDAVDAMNNLAGEALVIRNTGGQRGGGARLTPRATELLALYQTVSREHQLFMARLAQSGAGHTQNLELIEHMAIQTSARNRLAGTVHAIKTGAVNDEVTLDLGDGYVIVASITRESVENLGLRHGKRAVALVKASSVMVGLPAADARLSARNQLEGRISRITKGAVSADVCIELKQGSVIAAIISLDSVNALKLRKNARATAIFKASSVMLGVMD
jgi:molybdate transport system regulatory protein